MNLSLAETVKLWRTAPLAWFVLAFVVLNALLVLTGPDPGYPRFVAATHAGAPAADPALEARLASDLAGLTNVFVGFEPEEQGRAYQRALGYRGVVADLMAAKYARAVPVVVERAATERALDPYYASDTGEVHEFLVGTLLSVVTLEAFLLAVVAGLHSHAVERHRGPAQVVFVTRAGRGLLKAKLAAVLVSVAVAHAVLAIGVLGFAGPRYGLAGVWSDSVSSGFHLIRDVVVGFRPFFTWLDLSVGSYLLLSALVALCLALVVALLSFTVGALVPNSYLGFGMLLLGGGALFAAPIAGGISLFGMLAALNPVWLWLKQPSWFTDGGLDVVVPHFEGAATAAWLAIAGLAALVGFRRFREADL